MGRAWVLLAVALAGCMASQPGTLLFVSARDLIIVADEAAHDWNAQSFLIRVHAIEPSHAMPEMAHLAGAADPRPGDGLAQAWEFVYGNGKDWYVVIVGSDGRILKEGVAAEEPSEEGYIRFYVPLKWNLDSDEIVQIIRRNAPDWDEVARTAPAVHWYLVFAEGEDAHWLIGASGDAERGYLINARNGSFSRFDIALFLGAALPRWEGARQTVVLSPQQPTMRWPFTVEAAHHPLLNVGLHVDRATTGAVNLTLKRGDRDVAWTEWRASDMTGVRKASVPVPQNGTYELVARLTSLTPQSIELFWCATGVPSGSIRGHACGL